MATRKIWEVFPRLTERIYADHAEAGMLGGHHDPDHAIRVGQMAMEIAKNKNIGILAGVAGLVHNADRILQHKLKLGSRRDAPKEDVAGLVRGQLEPEQRDLFWPLLECRFILRGDASFMGAVEIVIDAVLKHDGKNNDDDSQVLVTLMDADRLVNAEPDLVIRSAQLYHDLPPIDPVHFEKDPTANYRDPKSVLRDIMETLEWLTPGTPFYVRLPKARELAATRRKFFDYFILSIKAERAATGFHPYPPELVALRDMFAAAATAK